MPGALSPAGLVASAPCQAACPVRLLPVRKTRGISDSVPAGLEKFLDGACQPAAQHAASSTSAACTWLPPLHVTCRTAPLSCMRLALAPSQHTCRAEWQRYSSHVVAGTPSVGSLMRRMADQVPVRALACQVDTLHLGKVLHKLLGSLEVDHDAATVCKSVT